MAILTKEKVGAYAKQYYRKAKNGIEGLANNVVTKVLFFSKSIKTGIIVGSITFVLISFFSITFGVIQTFTPTPHTYCTIDMVNQNDINCGIYSGSNDTIVDAAISLADPSVAGVSLPVLQYQGHRGTPFYRDIFDKVGMTGKYDNCIGFTATVIRWTGIDVNFPRMDPANYVSYGYFTDRPNEWQEIPWNGDISVLQPGDVLMSEYKTITRVSHTIIYVGEEAIIEMYPELAGYGFNAVHAIWGKCGPVFTKMQDNLNYKWHAYRCLV